MRFELAVLLMMARPIVQDCIRASGTKHALRSQSLLDAYGSPRHETGRGLDRPDDILLRSSCL
jgi:hypothetical protein